LLGSDFFLPFGSSTLGEFLSTGFLVTLVTFDSKYFKSTFSLGEMIELLMGSGASLSLLFLTGISVLCGEFFGS